MTPMLASPAPSRRPAANRATLAARGALGLLAAALLYGVARLAIRAAFALDYPYGLDYGEGTVWQQMRGIIAGEGYPPLQLLPAFVYEYPPLYHLVATGTARVFGIDELSAGRLASLVATGACAVLVGLLTRALLPDASARERAGAAWTAGLLFATMPVVLSWSVLMRVDMLACALTLGGTLLAIRAVAEPRAAIWAGVVFAAAMFTRQTCLPAPAAAFGVLLVVKPRAAWTMVVAALASGLPALALLEVATSAQFLTHILFYNINRIVWAHGAQLAAVLAANLVTLALGVLGAAAVAKGLSMRRLRAEPERAAGAILLLTLLFKTLTLPAILKSGASDNYLLDWFAIVAVFAAFAAAPTIRAAAGRGEARATLLLLFGLGVPVQMSVPGLLPDRSYAYNRPSLDALAARIAASRKPVVSDDMVLVLRGGQRVIWEPAIIAELGASGIYDEPALARAVRRGDFGFFVTTGTRGTTLFDERFNPRIADALDEAYPRREPMGGLNVRLP